MSKVRRVSLVAFAIGALMLTATACPGQPNGGSGGNGQTSAWAVNPVDADPASTPDTVNVNLAYAPATGVTPKNRLVVILPGTSAQTGAYQEMVGAYTTAGFHVIVLRYSSDVSTQAACPDSAALTDPDCHRKIRSEITFGENIPGPSGPGYDNPVAHVTKANSVANRLIKLVDRLNTIAPTKGWSQYQVRSAGTCTHVNATYGGCDLDWSKLALIGHSQGSGLSLYLSKFFSVSAVGMASGSYDAFIFDDGSTLVAPWVTEPFATPNFKITTLNHVLDAGFDMENAVADAIPIVGAQVDASVASAPYGGSHRLITTATSTCPWDTARSHNSTAIDLCAPDGLYVAAWRYMAAA